MENVKMSVKEFLLKCINNNKNIEDYFCLCNGVLFTIEGCYITKYEITLKNYSYDISIDIPFNSEEKIIYSINI